MTERSTAKAPENVSGANGRPYDQVTVTDPRLDDKRYLLEGIDVSDPEKAPHFTVSEVARVFFGRTSHWIRWQEGLGNFSLDGTEVGTDRTPSGARTYTLADVELMAHALATNGAISGRQLNDALLVVSTNARIWGFI